MWRLWWEKREVDEANQHDDTEEWHRQEWVDKDESQNGGKGDQLEHLDGKETTVWELSSAHLSENVWRKRWDEADAASNHALDLSLDGRVRVNGLEDTALKVEVSTDSASHSVKVLAKGNNGDNRQEDVEKSEVDKGLRLLLNYHGISLNNHALSGLGIVQSLSTRRRDGSLFVSTHQATVAWATKRERETWTLEHIRAHFGQTTGHADTVLVKDFRFEELVSVLNNLLGDNFRLLSTALHEAVDHRVENLFWSREVLGLLLGLLFSCVRNAVKADDGSLHRLLKSLSDHLVQNGGQIKHLGWRGHWIHHEIHERVARRSETKDRWRIEKKAVLRSRTEDCDVIRASCLNTLHCSAHFRAHRMVRAHWRVVSVACINMGSEQVS
jgi:hypothetical protein